MKMHLIEHMPCEAELSFPCDTWTGCHEAYERDSDTGQCKHQRVDGTCKSAERLVQWYRTHGEYFPWSSRGGVPREVLQDTNSIPNCSCFGGTTMQNDGVHAEFTGSSDIKGRWDTSTLTVLIRGKVYTVYGTETTEPVEAGGYMTAERIPVSFDFQAAYAFFRTLNLLPDFARQVAATNNALGQGEEPVQGQWDF